MRYFKNRLSLILLLCICEQALLLKERHHDAERVRRQTGVPSNLISIQYSTKNIVEILNNKTVTINIGDRLSSVGGVRIHIRCPFYGQPHPRAMWYFKGHVIDHVKYPNLDITEPNGVSVLTILKLDPYHVGDYKCAVYNRQGTRSSNSRVRQIVPGQPTIFSKRGVRQLSVTEKVANISIGTDLTVFQGTNLVFWCDVRPKGSSYSIRWITPSTSNPLTHVIRSEGSLEIPNASYRENGYYYCSVSNQNGPADQQRSSVRVIRKIKPSIQSRNDFVRYIRGSGEAYMQIGDTAIIKEGFTVKISCPFSAVPVGKISWLRNGMALALPSSNLYLVKDRTNTLVIEKIEMKHSDIYSCAVSNVLGKETASSNITVIPSLSSQPKVIEGSHRNVINIDSPKKLTTVTIGETVRIVEGASLKLKCQSTGLPEPRIIWTINRKPIDNDQFIESKNELLILNFKKEYAGDYKCVAKNIIGQSRAWSDIRIVEPTAPAIKPSDAYLKIADRSNLVKLVIGDTLKTSGGRDIEIKCPITGYPLPEPIWKHGDSMLKPHENTVINGEEQTLLLKSVDEWQSGTYSCFATNFAGVAVVTSKLKILPRGSPVITSQEKVLKVLDPTKSFVGISIGTNLTTTTGKSLRIVCPSLGYDNANVEWTINDKNLHYDTRIILSNGNELIINDLQFFDEGIYKCRVYSQYGFDTMASQIRVLGDLKDSGKTEETTITTMSNNNGNNLLQVKGTIRINSGTDITIISGQDVQIKCLNRGALRPTLQWFKDNIPINPSHRMTPRGGTLMLKELGVSDTGLYTCRVTTELGTKTTESNIKVLEYKPVKINHTPGRVRAIDSKQSVVAKIGTTVYAVAGVNIKILCPITALPEAKISWFFNNKMINNNDRFSQDKLTDALIISKLTEKDVGVYKCVGTQGEKKDEATSTIRLLSMSPSKINPSKREHFSNPLYNDLSYIRVGDSIVVNLGKRIQIDCEASGLPVPKYIWKFNDESLAEHKYIVDLKNGSILVQRVTWNHEGQFICFAVNSQGVDSVSTKIKVVGPYTPTRFRPVIKHVQVLKRSTKTTSVDIGTTISLRAGNNMIIKCPVSVYGGVNIYWVKDEKIFKGSRVHDDGSVFIRRVKLQDSGDYECYSKDEARLLFGAVKLKVIAPIDDLVESTKPEEVEFYFPQKTALDVALGSKVSILSGNIVRFMCPVVNDDTEVTVTWMKNKQPIKTMKDEYQVIGSTLTIKNTETGKHRITCRISGPLGSTTVTSDLYVVAPTPINLLEVNQDIVSTKSKTKVDVGGKVHVLDGSSIEMTCPVSSIPPPTIRWQRNKAELDEGTDSGAYMKKMGTTLTIPFVRRRSAGIYTCVATNQFGGEVKASLQVSVYVPRRPRFRSKIEGPVGGPNTIHIGDESGWQTERFIYTAKETYADKIGQDYKILTGPVFSLTCDVDGEPRPVIKWRRDGKLIPNARSTVYKIDTKDINGSGYYTCVAANAFGSLTSSSNVDILAPSKPIIQRDPNHVNRTEVLSETSGQTRVEVLIGDDLKTLTETNVYIRCPAIGIPRPTITFYKDGQLLGISQNIMIDNLGSLLLSPASKTLSSDGVYTCRAENNGGSHELNTTLKLYEPAKPEFLRPVTKPRFRYDRQKKEGILYMTVGQNTRAYPDTILVISCPVAGFPFPVVIWEKDGKAVTSGDIAVLKDNATTLAYRLSSLDDYGVFVCVAANSAGTVRKESIVNIAEPLAARILTTKPNVVTAWNLEANITIGQNANIMADSTLRILCPTLGEPKAKVTWSRKGSQPGDLETNPLVSFGAGGLEMTIRNIPSSLAGVYKCTADNAFGTDVKKSIVKVADSFAPEIMANNKTVVSRRGTQRLTVTVGGQLFVHRHTKVVIDCPVKGYPPPKVKWFKDEEPLIKNVDYDARTHRLRIKKVRLRNKGIFRCQAENFLNTVSAESKISVGYSPYIYRPKAGLSPIISSAAHSEIKIPIGVKEIYIRLGSTATFHCNIDSFPTANITWKLNKEPINIVETERYESLIPSVLSVKKVSAEDQGVYRCEVRNIYGWYWRESKLAAMEPPSISYDRTNISITDAATVRKHVRITIGGSLIVMKGMNIIIRCPAMGIPEPKITWNKVNRTTPLDSRIYVTHDNDLMITSGRVSDSGVWQCRAKNKVGEAIGQSVIAVADKPTAVVYPDFRNDKDGRTSLVSIARQNLVIPTGKLIRLKCHVTGSPEPKVTWLKGHDIIRESDRHKVVGKQLEIKGAKVEDVGAYLCMAENVMGATTAFTEITIGIPPRIDRTTRRNSTVVDGRKHVSFNIGTSRTIPVGATVRIYCNSTGLPKPSISWISEKGGGRKKTRTRIQSDLPDIITIRDFSKRDEGTYECQVRNYIGNDRARSTLALLDAASITKYIALKRWQNERLFMFSDTNKGHVIEGEAVRLVCAGIGYPTPSVSFYRAPQSLTDYEDFVEQLAPFNREVLRKEFELIQKNATEGVIPVGDNFRQMRRLLKIRVDGQQQRLVTVGQLFASKIEVQSSGLYTCRSKNKAGSASKSMHLYVHPKQERRFGGVWVALNYGECKGPCARANYATQGRNVYCMSPGGHVISNIKCNPEKKPPLTKECSSKECITEWAIEAWSECSRTCGRNGKQYRSPRCIYSKTGKTVSSQNCPHETKPESRRECNNFPCNEIQCVDKYQYCKLVSGMGFCEVEMYKSHCCQSCVRDRGRWGKH